MADKEKYMIKVEGKLVEVTPEVYYTYFRMERQERGQSFVQNQISEGSRPAVSKMDAAGRLCK